MSLAATSIVPTKTGASKCLTRSASPDRIFELGNPQAMCTTKGANRVLYVFNSNPWNDIDIADEIYRMRLDGTALGKFGHARKIAQGIRGGQLHRLPPAEILSLSVSLPILEYKNYCCTNLQCSMYALARNRRRLKTAVRNVSETPYTFAEIQVIAVHDNDQCAASKSLTSTVNRRQPAGNVASSSRQSRVGFDRHLQPNIDGRQDRQEAIR